MTKENLQNLTDKIARESGLETDLQGYHNPIYRAEMTGNFFRGLKRRNLLLTTLIVLAFLGLMLFAFLASIFLTR